MSSVCEGGVGGGFTAAGLVGEYYGNLAWTGPVGFVRRDVRVDFGTNGVLPGTNVMPPGGVGRVGDARFRSVPATGFSVRWTGGLVPRFTERYTFVVFARDQLTLRLRASGANDWATVIDQASYGGTASTGTVDLTAGVSYDIEVLFSHGAGPWEARLHWSSPSTPEETIDPLTQSGINNPDWTSGYTDIVKGARNSWEPTGGGPRPAMDAQGWPMGDGAYVFQESLNQGLDVDPLMRGRVAFSFVGKATVALQGNVRGNSLVYKYDAAKNQTTGTFSVINNGWNASYIIFTKSRRDGQPNGPAGITDLRLIRPVGPDSSTNYDGTNSLFTTHLLDAMGHFTVIRHQYVANQQRDWSERTLPAYFNQSGGISSPPHYGVGDASHNGASWEYKVLLANESGRDLMISIPTVASGRVAGDTSSYLWKLANLLRYGSDGVEPYTAPVSDPVYPPLNPNLRVYLELENELWNYGGVFYVDWANVNALAAADVLAGNDDFHAFNYDGLPTTRDGNGNYTSMSTWRFRKIALRMMQVSDIFRGVFGDVAMMSHVRPLYEWQYANANDTARLALTFVDRYFNNADGQNHVANPQPVSHWFWGGGGATYYGAVNGNGLTTLIADPSFGSPVLAQPGYQSTPSGSTWTFSGTAGIARDGGPTDDIPPAFRGSQMAYVTDHGSLSIRVTFPTNFTSPVFGVSFKAVNRIPVGGGGADKQNLRVYLDVTNDITARTFSQGNGYTPVGYDAGNPWYANNVFWTRSEYYFTRSFPVAPGSTHTITLRGMGNTGTPVVPGQTAFIGEVRVTSVDRIFADGMPGGGEATGQPIGEGIQNTMNVEASWAKAFGLEQLSYEGGWSLGGDDGGSWVQLRAKYGDSRTAGVQARFMEYFHRAGSAVNVFGTYAQWPSWADYYAEQGLLQAGAYPIVAGIDQAADQLPADPTNGTLLPAVLPPGASTLADMADGTRGRITGAGGWISWNVITPQSGRYAVSVHTALGGGNAVLLVDDTPLVAGGTLNAEGYLTRGLHSLKIRSSSATLVQITNITVSAVGGPGQASITSAVDGDSSATLQWTTVPGAMRYEVRYGTTPGHYTSIFDVGENTGFTATNLINGQQYYFVVLAANPNGLGLPSVERGLIPIGIAQSGPLAVWEFSGSSGGEVSTPVSSASTRVNVGPLRRGTGLVPSNSEWAAGMRANRFASEPAASAGHAYGATLAEAIAKKQYYEFTVAPAAGQLLKWQRLEFRAFYQNGGGAAGITFSTDGAIFGSEIQAVAPVGDPTGLWTVDLSGLTNLQWFRGTITIRICLYGLGAYQVSALGDEAGSDLVLIGSLRPLTVPLEVALSPNSDVRVSWPDIGPKATLELKSSLDRTIPWTPQGLSFWEFKRR